MCTRLCKSRELTPLYNGCSLQEGVGVCSFISFHVVFERPGKYWLHAGREASTVADSGLSVVSVCVRVRWLSVRSDCIDCIRTLAYYNLKSGSKVQSSPRISDVACWRMFKNLRNA